LKRKRKATKFWNESNEGKRKFARPRHRREILYPKLLLKVQTAFTSLRMGRSGRSYVRGNEPSGSRRGWEILE
jgi:hypothetical protein